jgi:hypothetical protein
MSIVLTPGAGIQSDLPLFRSRPDENAQLDNLLSILSDGRWHTAKYFGLIWADST